MFEVKKWVSSTLDTTDARHCSHEFPGMHGAPLTRRCLLGIEKYRHDDSLADERR